MLAIDPDTFSSERTPHRLFIEPQRLAHRCPVDCHAVTRLRRHRREHTEIWSLNIQPGWAAPLYPHLENLVQNQETNLAMNGVPHISPLMLYELLQRYNGHKRYK
jgi:hypothetical protein